MTETSEQPNGATKREMVPVKPRVPNTMRQAPGGGLAFLPTTYREVKELADILALAKSGVPQAFRGDAATCFMVCMDALAWGMLPTQVIRKAYVVSGMVAYEAQLIHAVVNARAGLKDDLQVTYEGDGTERRVIVRGILSRGSGAVKEYKSPKVKDIKVKNSPLWLADTDQQLHYYGTRSWARRWVPEVIMGVYTREEIESGEISVEDRATAIEAVATEVDWLDDDAQFDPDAPAPTAPLVHRYSYALEKARNEAEIQAAQMEHASEIGDVPTEQRGDLRNLLKRHLARVRGNVDADEVLTWSRAFRAEPADAAA